MPLLNNSLQCYICGIDKRNTCANLDFSGRLDFSAPTTDYDAYINEFKHESFQSSIFFFQRCEGILHSSLLGSQYLDKCDELRGQEEDLVF